MKKRLKIGFINGLNDYTKGMNNVNRLIPHLKKYKPDAFYDTDGATYGRIGIFIANYLWRFTWFVKIIPRIAKAMKVWDVVIVHSNGLNFCMQSLKRITNKNIKIISMSGSLDIDYKFKEDFKELHNYHSREDFIIKASRLTPFSDMGAGGAFGFNTTDKRIYNYDYTNIVHSKHSYYFSDKFIEIMAENINAIIDAND